MKKLLTLIPLLFLCSSLQARVKELSLEVRSMKTKRHAFYPEKRDWKYFLGLNWDLESRRSKAGWLLGGFKYQLFWENTVAFYSDRAQVRHIFWNWEIGSKFENFDLFYYHKSEHVADDVSSTGDKFPLEDSFGLRINLLGE